MLKGKKNRQMFLLLFIIPVILSVWFNLLSLLLNLETQKYDDHACSF